MRFMRVTAVCLYIITHSVKAIGHTLFFFYIMIGSTRSFIIVIIIIIIITVVVVIIIIIPLQPRGFG